MKSQCLKWGPLLPYEVGRIAQTVDEGCMKSQCLKWGPLFSNEVGRIAQHMRKERTGEFDKIKWIFIYFALSMIIVVQIHFKKY